MSVSISDNMVWQNKLKLINTFSMYITNFTIIWEHGKDVMCTIQTSHSMSYLAVDKLY